MAGIRQAWCGEMEAYDRLALVAAINDVLTHWHESHSKTGSALNVLDALGYTAGLIFSQAPDAETRAYGRDHFLGAIEEALLRAERVKHLN